MAKVLIGVLMQRNVPEASFRSFLPIARQGHLFTQIRYTRQDIAANQHIITMLEEGFDYTLILGTQHVHPPDIVDRMLAHVEADPTRLVICGSDEGSNHSSGSLQPLPEQYPANTNALFISRYAVEQLGPPPWFQYEDWRNPVTGQWDSLGWSFAKRCGEKNLQVWRDASLIIKDAQSSSELQCEILPSLRPQDEWPRVAVAVPLESDVHNLVFHNFMKIARQGWGWFSLPSTRCDVARNIFSATLLQTDYSHLLQLDSDHMHHLQVVQRLARWFKEDPNLGVVGGLNQRRGIPFDGCAWYLDAVKGELYCPKQWPPGLIKVELVGSGSIMVSRKVFERCRPPWWWYRYQEGNPKTFPGVDIQFCTRCAENQIPVHVDTTTTSPHMLMQLITPDWFLRYANNEKLEEIQQEIPYARVKLIDTDLDNSKMEVRPEPEEPEEAKPIVKKKESKARVGFVTIWFERGQAYVTKALRDAIEGPYDTHILARMGGVYSVPKLEVWGDWRVPNLSVYQKSYQVPPETLLKWASDMRIDVVVFNEEYDWALVAAAKKAGLKTVGYLDWYGDSWRPRMGLYDMVLCSTHRTYDLVKEHCNAKYIGWGIDTELFKRRREATHSFFHNAGWLGLNYRKNTPGAIEAFHSLDNDWTLLVHAQADLGKLPAETRAILQEDKRITYRIATVPAPGIYDLGRILLFPTKLEGLGLPLLEGLSMGLPAIATDAPPMNEFVEDNYNGLLVRVAKTQARGDGVGFPENLINQGHLVERMRWLASRPETIDRMALSARSYAEDQLSLPRFQERVRACFDEVLG